MKPDNLYGEKYAEKLNGLAARIGWFRELKAVQSS